MRDKDGQKISIKDMFISTWLITKLAWQTKKSAYILFMFGAILETSSMVVILYATAKLGSILASYIFSNNADGIWFWLIIETVAGVTTSISMSIMSYAKQISYYHLTRRVIYLFLASMSTIDINDFYDNKFRKLINKVSDNYIWHIPNHLYSSEELIYAVMRFTVIVALVAQIAWWMIFVVVIFLIPSLLTETKTARNQWFIWDSKGDTKYIFWGLENIIKRVKSQMEVRTLQVKDYILSKIDNMNRDFYSEQEDKYKKMQKFSLPANALSSLGTLIGSVILIMQLLARTITFEKYLFLTGGLTRVGGAISNIFGTLSRMNNSAMLTANYFEILERKPKIIDQKNSTKIGVKPPTIEFKNVYFTYPGVNNKPVFKNLCLKIESGDHVALVGENGSGKSTFIKLLLRFYKVDSGEILVNGVNINNIAIESFYSILATLFQDFNHYPLSIAENISIGRSDKKANMANLEKSSKFSNVDELLKIYKHGWDTVLDASFKKGVEPSGGQWQRVALARAFYRNAEMIILDEPTSAIDAKAEYDIFNNIFDQYRDKTALIVSHRFSTVRRANKIIVLDRGSIIEEGSHAELMSNKSLYFELFSKQAKGYKD